MDLATLSPQEREELRQRLDNEFENEDPRLSMPDVQASQVKSWREDFNQALTIAETIRRKYDGKKGSEPGVDVMTADERQKYENAINHADELKSLITSGEKALTCMSWAKQAKGSGLPMGGAAKAFGDSTAHDIEAIKKAHKGAWRVYLSGQREYKDESARLKAPAVKAYHELIAAKPQAFKAYVESSVPDELKAYQVDNPVGGGYAQMPQEIVQEFITLLKDLVYVRSLARIFPLPKAESLGAPALDTDPSDDDWTNELGTGNEETTAALGKREFRPHPVAKLIKMSKTLLRKVPEFETLIMDRLAYKMGITEEKAFLSGTGADQPLGVFTASSQGISTARDVTAATTTAIAGNDIIQTFYNLKAGYRNRSSWILNRTVVSAVRQLKDSNGNYLWTTALPGTVAQPVTGPGGGLQGTPEYLMGRPIMESEYAPGTLTTGLYVAIIGDWSKYWIADALDMDVQTLYELYAATNQMGYILRKETDGVNNCALAA